MTQLFVGLKFFSDSHLAKKIDSFQARFDPKYFRNPRLCMSLLAPFEAEVQEVESLVEELTEEIESFFFDVDAPTLGFFGLGVSKAKKDYLLYLNPNFSTDLEHMIESVTSICKNYVPHTFKYHTSKKQFLPIGRFFDGDTLNLKSKQAEEEFSFQSELGIQGISLYEKRHGAWTEVRELIDFEKVDETFLHSKVSNL